jgi:hypothetical protein
MFDSLTLAGITAALVITPVVVGLAYKDLSANNLNTVLKEADTNRQALNETRCTDNPRTSAKLYLVCDKDS